MRIKYGLFLTPLLLMPGTSSAQPECSDFSATRQPFFGELHLHTQYSADAAMRIGSPRARRSAYRRSWIRARIRTPGSDQNKPFPPVNGVAQHPYCLPPDRCEFTATRTAQLPKGRTLDFAAITDHSEFLGETNICFFEGGNACQDDSECGDPGQICSPLDQRCVPRGYDSPSCGILRQEITRVRGGRGELLLGINVSPEFPTRLPFCNEAGAGGDSTCLFQAQNV